MRSTFKTSENTPIMDFGNLSVIIRNLKEDFIFKYERIDHKKLLERMIYFSSTEGFKF
jgi:hypothetical protein